jgi:hypothetical protein
VTAAVLACLTVALAAGRTVGKDACCPDEPPGAASRSQASPGDPVAANDLRDWRFGYVIRLLAALGAQTVGTADNTLTGKINGVAMVHDTWKQPTSGSAAYEIDSANASPLAPANHVQAGDSIQFTSDGAGSNTTSTQFTALIRMD